MSKTILKTLENYYDFYIYVILDMSKTSKHDFEPYAIFYIYVILDMSKTPIFK